MSALFARKRLLFALETDPSCGGEVVRESVRPYETPEGCAAAIGDLVAYLGPVPPGYSLRSLRIIATLLEFLGGLREAVCAMEPSPFVSWDPHFSSFGDAEPGEDGLVWLYDAEGEPLLKCRLPQARVIAAALEYAHADVEAIYGLGWGNLTDEQVVELLRKHQGEHPHVQQEVGE